MTLSHFILAILGVIMIYGLVQVNRAWAEQRRIEVEARTAVELSRQETARFRILAARITGQLPDETGQ